MKTGYKTIKNRAYLANRRMKSFLFAVFFLFIIHQINCYEQAVHDNDLKRRMFQMPNNTSTANRSIHSEQSEKELISIHEKSTSPRIVIDDGTRNQEQANLSWISEALEGSSNISTTPQPKDIGDGAIHPELVNLYPMSEAVEGSSNISSTPPPMTDLSNLSFAIFNNVCRDVTDLPILAVMLVTSHAGYADRRNDIRKAYPTSELTTLGIRRVFLLASLVNDTEPSPYYKSISQDRLIEENQLHQDILQSNFIEAYFNLTYKNLMGIKYASTYCTSAQFVMKMDDDTIYDVYQLIEVLKSVKLAEMHRLVGNFNNRVVLRDITSKWYVSRTQYAPNSYPTYLSGYFYFTSIKTAAVLVETSLQFPYISVDDALITGIVAERAGIQRHQMDGLSAKTLNCCRDIVNNIKYRCTSVAAVQYRYNKEMLLKIKEHSADCYYNKNCKQKSDMKLYTSHIICF